MPRHRTMLLTAAAVAVALPVTAGGAAARSADSDHDHMPDRWEHAHGLRVHRDDARGDRDHDGLRNRAEFRAGTDPRDPDSDDDGILDGDEDAGTVTSFAGGVLTLTTWDGATLTGRVTARTEVDCHVAPAAVGSDGSAGVRSDGGGGGGSGRGSGHGGTGHGADEQEHGAEHEDGEDAPGHPEAEHGVTGATGATGAAGDPAPHGTTGATGAAGGAVRRCGSAALVAGARVEEAKLSVTRAGRVWREVVLAR